MEGANLKDEGDLAIEARGVVKNYGSTSVLKGLDMNVQYGSIYGLLGSSGCGKTTLLRCILGRFNLARGHIAVLGQSPGAAGHQIPGRDVGYMPQEMALYEAFTMSETLVYFGILHGMSMKDIRQRREFLQEFLELPSPKKLIRTLSGGQKRRFSFAIAMLQTPPLMILDEPTVGVDPILRAKIWQHLVELVSTNRMTIVITTHYIEEARQANTVGLMRDGKLLAEDSPSALILSYGLNTLEEVFLQLCRKQDIGNQSASNNSLSSSSPLRSPCGSPSVNTDDYDEGSVETIPLLQNEVLTDRRDDEGAVTFRNTISQKVSGIVTSLTTSFNGSLNLRSSLPRPINIAALCWKNLMHIYRNPGLLLFQFLIPALQIVIFSLAIGQNLKGIRIAYTNNDSGVPFSLSLYCNNTDIDNGLLNVSSLGELYISKLLDVETFIMVKYDEVNDAIDQVKDGHAWSAIYLQKEFTIDMLIRMCSVEPSKCYGKGRPLPDPIPVTNETIDGSSVHMYSDLTNFQISVTVNNQTLLAYELFLTQLIQSCSNLLTINSSMLSPPLVIEQPPVYGRRDLSFTDYMAPGMITSIIFGISIGLCAMALIVERNEGLIDRTWVAGVNVTEIVISQILTQFFVLFVQTTLLLVVAIFGFKVYTAYMPNIWVIGVITMIQGLTGMAFGLFLSAVCSKENEAIQLSIAVFYPSMLLSGVIWPLEGMPTWLRHISYFLPGTFAAEAMRAVMGRGWGFEHFIVLRGFLMSTGWFLFLVLVAGFAFSLRK